MQDANTTHEGSSVLHRGRNGKGVYLCVYLGIVAGNGHRTKLLFKAQTDLTTFDLLKGVLTSVEQKTTAHIIYGGGLQNLQTHLNRVCRFFSETFPSLSVVNQKTRNVCFRIRAIRRHQCEVIKVYLSLFPGFRVGKLHPKQERFGLPC